MSGGNSMESNGMLLIVLQSLALGSASGVIAAVYREILAYEPVLSWWFQFGAKYEGRWFWLPVWGCAKCIAGQLALWFYLFIRVQRAQAQEFSDLAAIVFGLIFAISLAILVAFLLSKAIQFFTDK